MARHEIAGSDLALRRREIPAGLDAVSDIAQVAGKAAQRALRTDDIINQRWLREPVLVQRGSMVTIAVDQGGVEARVAGEVLEQGKRNDVVRVRNVASGKVIEARVVSAGTVEPAGLPAH